MKPETEIRNLKRELRDLLRMRNDASNEARMYRVRATKAEAELAEWKTRFDVLLRRDEKPVV